jgi:hypothetical protein
VNGMDGVSLYFQLTANLRRLQSKLNRLDRPREALGVVHDAGRGIGLVGEFF